MHELFDPIVDLSQVDTPAFRSRILCWATTGTPTLDASSPDIKVGILRLANAALTSHFILFQIQFVSDNDEGYASANIRAGMIAQGKISYATCHRTARIPASFIIGLTREDYSSRQEPSNARDAIDNWLFNELIDAIGNHTKA